MQKVKGKLILAHILQNKLEFNKLLNMKISKLLLMVFLCFSCNNQQESGSVDNSATSILVEQWLSWNGDGKMPHVVFVSGDEEYRSEEALPQLAQILSKRHGFKCTVLFAQDPQKPGIIDPNYRQNIPGLEQLATADMMVIFTRFRALPDEQMKHIDDFLKSGKPMLGMRTATHAFHYGEKETNYSHYDNYNKSDDDWKDGFGRLVMGEHWISHHGNHGHQSTKGIIVSEEKNHSILNGIQNGDIWGPTDVYGVRLPLPGDSKPLVLGQVIEREKPYDETDPMLGMRFEDGKAPKPIMKKDKDGKEYEVDQNNPMMPIVWIKSYQIPGGKQGKCFSTTMGASTDLLTEGTRRVLVNCVFWCLDLDVPAKANVDLVGTYTPTRFAFHKDEYWDQKNMKISALK